MRTRIASVFLIFVLVLSVSPAAAQTSAFSYNGSLSNNGSPANGNYDFEFKLFDAVGGGAQQGATIQKLNIAVTNGAFNVTLDFGADVFTGQARFLEISVRASGGGTFTVLSPRQQILSAPYAVKSAGAMNADMLSLNCVSCVTDGQISGLAGSKIIGQIPPTSIPAGSGNYIQNSTTLQPTSDFNISGTGRADIFNAVTQYNIGGSRVLSVAGTNNLFAGLNAGAANTTGTFNSFVGSFAGAANTTGNANTFFGSGAGAANTIGGVNSFFGIGAGSANTTGNANAFFGFGAGNANTTADGNSFFGYNAGAANITGFANAFFGNNAGLANTTAGGNSFFGHSAGASNTTACCNSFFGQGAGGVNTTGQANSFFGWQAGTANTTGGANSFFGNGAGLANTTGGNNSFFGINAGFANTTASGNSFFGAGAGAANTTGGANSFFGINAGVANTTGNNNSFFGINAGFANTTATDNSFFGAGAGAANTTGNANAFFGGGAGLSNTTGEFNSFFGNSAGMANTTGFHNSFFGFNAGRANTTGGSNAFFGINAGSANTTGSINAFFGGAAGEANTTGNSNTFVGVYAGESNTIGSGNTYVGTEAGRFITTATNNTLIGFQATAADNLSNATAIGANAFVGSSNTVVLGTSGNTVQVPGNLNITGILSKGGGSFKIDHPLDPLNKTLSHSFVESPDMMNIYNGNVVTDRRGLATITLPEWFEALNRDFRYQLTVIGTFAQAIVAREIQDNRFTIKTNAPNVKVSWQVTGIRQDAYANKHRILVEEEKPLNERGAYLHPDAFNQPGSKLSPVSVKTRTHHGYLKWKR